MELAIEQNNTKPKTKIYTQRGQMVNGAWSFGVWYTNFFGFLVLTPWFRLERQV